MYLTSRSLSTCTVFGLAILAHLLFFFFLACFRAFRDALHSRFRCQHLKLCLLDYLRILGLARFSNLHTWNSLVEVYRFTQCLGWRFLLISSFFSLVSSCAFKNAPHLRVRCKIPNQCLPNFSKMLLLALPQIYTRVFHLWKVY